MYINAVNEIAFKFLGFPIYWYGIIMAFAIFVGISLGDKLYNNAYKYDRKEVIYEFAPIIIIVGIISARLYFCLLNYEYYFSNPLEILNLRQGGLSIHGGIIGGILAFVYIAKRARVRIFRLLDAASCSTILAQAIGRWGNYFNSEAYGLPTNQNWGLFIPPTNRISQYAQYSYYHPTFLYESILDFIGFFILLYFFKKYQNNAHNGYVFFLYIIIYSIIRILIEPIRVDSALNIGNCPIALIVSLIMLIFGIIGFLHIKKKNY